MEVVSEEQGDGGQPSVAYKGQVADIGCAVLLHN